MIRAAETSPQFTPGQLVRHRRYGYRGAVIKVDLKCLAPENWYQSNQTQPLRHQPWYHVLVDGTATATYAAQDNLQIEEDPQPLSHPLLDIFFSSFQEDHYVRNDAKWQGWERKDEA
ncbi:MAG: heat shock protein HspQ [Planctomycetales bacterium]